MDPDLGSASGWPLVSRRSVLKAAVAGAAASALAPLELLTVLPQRVAAAMPVRPRDIQYDISPFIAPARRFDGILFRFGPVHTRFTTLRLTRTPTQLDQQHLTRALARLEEAYPWRADGLFTFVSYGIPYFQRLPGGMRRCAAAGWIPSLREDPQRLALEEAVPSPTDVVAGNGISKQRFNVPVTIEQNEVLVTMRSDSLASIDDAITWLVGRSRTLAGHDEDAFPGAAPLFEVTSSRAMFQQPGLPRQVATRAGLSFASRIHPHSPMWMGFADQQVDGSGPAEITTFCGSASARLTDADGGHYMDNGAIQALSHVILDLDQFYADTEPYAERVQYMFRSDPIPSAGYANQYADGGGPSYLDNLFKGPDDALRNASAVGTDNREHRMGHLSALQRSSRAADGTPLHIRMDGPGFDAMDIPDGSAQAKLQFTIFMPTASRFRRMRKDQAALDLVKAHHVQPDDNGLERFLTATRRQNFLVPPRRHRAFPLLEVDAS